MFTLLPSRPTRRAVYQRSHALTSIHLEK